MNKVTALLFAACFLPLAAAAQEHCLSHTITERWLQARGMHVDLAHEAAVLEQQGGLREGVRTVPVAVHVVWNTTAQNVSNTVINNIIARMNADYQALNTDFNNVRSPFLASRGNAQIGFCLATVDPTGNPTSGITRSQTTKTWFNPDTETDLMKGVTYGQTAWDPNKYLNIWICNISSGATGGYVTAGYAYLPVGGIVGTPADGLVLDYSYGTMDRTASHEIGHYFGLDHPWGNGNCSPGDGISDTPPTDSPTFSCSNTNLMKCSTLTQYENFMDYSNCAVMFTNGQATVMNNILSGVRSSLLTSNGCGGALSGPCIPTSANGPADGDYINGVVLGTISNTNTGSATGPAYNDYMSMSSVLARGGTYSISITGGSYTGDHYAAWIDYNKDNTFSSSEKLGEFTSTSGGQTQSISFTVPANATLGNTRLRVRGVYITSGEPNPADPCFNYAYGETEDYSITITTANGALCIPTSAVGTADGDFVDGVALQGIQNMGSGSMSTPTYQDYTSTYSATLTKGANYTLQVTNGEYSEDMVGAWIDFNGDNQFTADEKIGEAVTSAPFQTTPFTFTVPQSALPGNTVMRVRAVFADEGEPTAVDPCFSFHWGETEDYRIVITAPAGVGAFNGQALTLQTVPDGMLVSWPAATAGQQALVLDASGRAVRLQKPVGNQLMVRTTDLAAGVYQVVVTLDDQRLAARFVVGGH